MKIQNLPILVFVVSWFGFLVYWISTLEQLPQRVATHFGPSGNPDGWMTKTEDAFLTTAVGLGLPLLIVGVFYLLRFAPNRLINFPGPHRDRWLGPERRAATMTYLFRHSFWLASLMIGLMAGVHRLTIEANRQVAAPHLSVPATFVLLGCFLIAFITWFIAMFRHFRYFR